MSKHLLEFRKRIIKCVCVIGILFICFFCVAERLYEQLATPLIKQLPVGSTLIATQVTTPFLVPMKLSFVTACFVSIPYILYNIWAFIAPGLYTHERKQLAPLVIFSCLLFFLGIAFAFYIICPLALAFFTQCAPKNVTVMTDISSYLDFILTMLFATGFAFQIPIVTILCIRNGIIEKEQLTKQRPYYIVLAFILGMLLTPPDVISQILLAVPIWGLFEIGLIFGTKNTFSKDCS